MTARVIHEAGPVVVSLPAPRFDRDRHSVSFPRWNVKEVEVHQLVSRAGQWLRVED